MHEEKRNHRQKWLHTIEYKRAASCKETMAMWAKLGMDYKKITIPWD
jgi:hypothetical protein